jgi:hypothetical protein
MFKNHFVDPKIMTAGCWISHELNSLEMCLESRGKELTDTTNSSVFNFKNMHPAAGGQGKCWYFCSNTDGQKMMDALVELAGNKATSSAAAVLRRF